MLEKSESKGRRMAGGFASPKEISLVKLPGIGGGVAVLPLSDPAGLG